MSDTRGVWRSRGWIGGFVLALVASVLPIAQQIGSVDAAPEVGVWEATAARSGHAHPDRRRHGHARVRRDSRPDRPSATRTPARGGGVPERAWQLSTIVGVARPGHGAVHVHGLPRLLPGDRSPAGVRHARGISSYVDLVNAGPVDLLHRHRPAVSRTRAPTRSPSHPGDDVRLHRLGLELRLQRHAPGPARPRYGHDGRLAPSSHRPTSRRTRRGARRHRCRAPRRGRSPSPARPAGTSSRSRPTRQVQVTLAGLAANFDLAIYRDIEQAFEQLTSPSDLARLGAQFAADAYAPSIYSPSIYSPSIYSPSIYSPSIYSPSIYSPSIYSPSIYSPSIYSPSIYSPSIYSPEHLFAVDLQPEHLLAVDLQPEHLQPGPDGGRPGVPRGVHRRADAEPDHRVRARGHRSRDDPHRHVEQHGQLLRPGLRSQRRVVARRRSRSRSIVRTVRAATSRSTPTAVTRTISGLPTGKQTIILTDSTRFATAPGAGLPHVAERARRPVPTAQTATA